MSTMNLIVFAIPFFLGTVALEAAIARRHRDVPQTKKGYATKDTFASLGMGVGNVILAVLFKFFSFGLLLWVYDHRLLDIPEVWWAWPLLILAEDFCYYWFHRIHHEVRLFWAAHVNHHSSQHYNLSTALRQSWTTPVTGPIFWAPLALVGFDPKMIIVAQVVSLLYQYWIHTEFIRRLGPLEWILNTPSHHRVHHGRNVQYLDKNYGGIFILYDRLFGTFEAEVEKVDYGLTKNIHTFNPVRIAFHEWAAMLRDAWRAPTLRGKLGYLVMPPGWKHDGTGATAAQLAAAAELAASAELASQSREGASGAISGHGLQSSSS